MSRLLGVGPEKLILMETKSNLLLQAHQANDLREWSAGVGKARNGIILEFRASKPWILVAPSVENLKSVTAALWDMVGTASRPMDGLPFHQDVLDFGIYMFDLFCAANVLLVILL